MSAAEASQPLVIDESRPAAATRLRRIPRGKVARGGVLVIGSTLVWHASNFGFNAVAARELGPHGYATLAAVVALLYVASPVFVTVQTVASRTVTELEARGAGGAVAGLMRLYAGRLALAGLFLTGAFALGSTALARFLRVPSALPLAILGGAFAVGLITHMQRGVMQGTMSFGRYAASSVFEGAGKLLLTVVLLLAVWRSPDAAVLAMLVATAAAVGFNALLLRSRGRPQPTEAASLPVSGYSLLALGNLVLLAMLLSLDVLAAKRYLDPEQAGLYAAISLCGKIVFFASSSISLYLFPIFSARQERGLDARATLRRGLAALTCGSLVLTGVYLAAPELVIHPLFGARFSSAADYLPQAGVAFGAYGVVYMTAMFLLAQRRLAGLVLLGAAALGQAAGLYVFHGGVAQIVRVDLAVFVVAGVVLAALALRPSRRPAV
jgi:O-antigen/teichoic acid export membrane protein